MPGANSSATNSVAEFLTVLVIFVLVLVVTWLVTKWIAGYQRGRNFGKNLEIIETFKIAPNKYVQIIRMGKKYVAIAVGKDTVTMLTEIPEDQLQLPEERKDRTQKSFREILAEYREKDTKEEK